MCCGWRVCQKKRAPFIDPRSSYYDCIRVLGFGGRCWEVFLWNHMRWGFFVVLVSKFVVIGLCVRIYVHHLSIAGAHMLHVRLDNDKAQPSTQRASSIQSTHGKYNPSRALVNGFCLLSTNIVAFRHCFRLNWSDVEMPSQSSSFAFLSSSHGHTRRNASQTMRV